MPCSRNGPLGAKCGRRHGHIRWHRWWPGKIPTRGNLGTAVDIALGVDTGVPNATYELKKHAWVPIGTARLDPGAGSMWLASSNVNPLRMPNSSHGAFFELIVSGPGSSFGKEVAAFTWSSAKRHSARNLTASA